MASDSDSDSDSGSSSSDEPVRVPKGSSGDDADTSDDDSSDDDSSGDGAKAAKKGDDDDSSSGGSFASDDNSDNDKPEKKKSVSKPSKAGRSSGGVPEGISEEAMQAFFSKPVEEDEDEPKEKARKAPERNKSLEISDSLMRTTEVEMKKRRDELSMSQHSLASCEDMLANLSAEFEADDPLAMNVPEFSIEEEARKYRENGDKEPKVPKVTANTILQNKREMRLAKVRDRIRKKEEAKEKEEVDKLGEKMQNAHNINANLDMSDDARRDRAYAWYTRMAMPNRVDMKERVNEMPASAGIGVDDIDLLPWGASGKMVNVAKMQKFINAGFKKKFTRKAKVGAAPVVSDSDSD
jgi:hypothetical protein